MPEATDGRGAAEFVPEDADLRDLRDAALQCRGCDLYRNATQTVFGAGDTGARIVLVGEQPGDREDRDGKPFVGPSGVVLDKALGEAGIDRSDAYVTNVVKHFKFRNVGKRRIHETPNRTEIVACRPWLVAELALLQPEVMVCLGAVAAKAVFGPSFRLTEQRGVVLHVPDSAGLPWSGTDGPPTVATVHPSAVLRAEVRSALRAYLVNDLRVAAAQLG
jgi:uracil-DNA glycosylase